MTFTTNKNYEGKIIEVEKTSNGGNLTTKQMLSKIMKTLDYVLVVLDKHTKMLEEHSRILDQHTKMLEEHNTLFKQHGWIK